MDFSEKQNLPKWLTSERTYHLVQQLDEQLKIAKLTSNSASKHGKSRKKFKQLLLLTAA